MARNYPSRRLATLMLLQETLPFPASGIGRQGGLSSLSLLVTALIVCAAGLICTGGCSRARLSRQVDESWRKTKANREELERIDPALVKYREAGRIDTGFSEARGLALGPDGRIYVAGDQAVRVLSQDGALQGEFALSGPPYCLAVAGDGAIVVGRKDYVEIYDAEGQLQATWQRLASRAYLTCVALSGDDVYVADAGDRAVLRYSRSGQLLSLIGQRDDTRGIPGLVVPSPHLDVAVGSDGLLRVNNPGRRLVETYTAEGDLKGSWGRASQDLDGFCGCCNPTDIAVFPDGRVVTSEKGLVRVKVYDGWGKLEAIVAGPEAFAKGAAGLDLATDARGRVFVLDPKADEVIIFEPSEAARE